MFLRRFKSWRLRNKALAQLAKNRRQCLDRFFVTAEDYADTTGRDSKGRLQRSFFSNEFANLDKIENQIRRIRDGEDPMIVLMDS